jgi:hypothetical protein
MFLFTTIKLPLRLPFLLKKLIGKKLGPRIESLDRTGLDISPLDVDAI